MRWLAGRGASVISERRFLATLKRIYRKPSLFSTFLRISKDYSHLWVSTDPRRSLFFRILKSASVFENGEAHIPDILLNNLYEYPSKFTRKYIDL